MNITKLKQVETIANKYFRCIVRPINDISAKGYKGVKLIVGEKRNPAYDPAIDPNSPDLPIELKQNKDLLANKTNPAMPDVRILWLPPGLTEQELIDNYILKIEKSLKAVKPVIKKDPTLTKLETESDADLAAQLASGEKIDSRFEEWDDGYEEEDDGYEEEDEELGEENVPEEPQAPVETKAESADTNPIMEALEQIGKNMEVLSNDINNVSDNFTNLEERVANMESGGVKVKKATPKKKKTGNKQNQNKDI